MIDVEIDDEAWTQALPDAAAVVEEAALAALLAVQSDVATESASFEAASRRLRMRDGGVDSKGPHPEARAEGAPRRTRESDHTGGIVILLTDAAAVLDLNTRFRDKPTPTNVLSFPAAPNPEDHLGDIALAYGVCAAEAKTQHKTLADHLRHLTAHGVLHLLGYDHQIDSEAEAMEALERRILKGLGVADPYAGEGG